MTYTDAEMKRMEADMKKEPLFALFHDNRPQPTAVSRKKVRRTLQQIEDGPLAFVEGFARRRPWGFGVACLGLVLTLSGTAFALSNWIGREDYSPNSYLTVTGEEQNQQTAIMDVEQVIQGADPRTEGNSVVLLPEMEDADTLNEWRVRNGQAAFAETDWGWLREIQPQVQKVLYDGTVLSYTIRLNTNHALAFSPEHVEKQWLDAFVEQTTFTDSGEEIPSFMEETSLLEETMDEGGISLYCSASLQSPLPEERRVSLTSKITLQDMLVDSMAHVGQIGTVYCTFSFNVCDALAAANAQKVVTDRELQGQAVLTMDYDVMENHPVSLDGVVLEETASYRSTGVYVSYRVKKAPQDWDQRMKRSLLSPSNERGKFEGLSVAYMVGQEGEWCEPEFPQVAVLEDGTLAYTVVLPVFPSDYEQVKAQGLQLRLTLHAVDSFDEEPVGDTWVQSSFPENGFDITTRPQVLGVYSIQLP